MTPSEPDIRATQTALTSEPRTLPQLAANLRGMTTEQVDAALLELQRRGDARYSFMMNVPMWSAPGRKV